MVVELLGEALNVGTDADGVWYNAAYGNNAGVARIHRWLTGGTERMRIDEVGNVGIGNASPASSLTVAGVIESTTGGVKFPDGTTQTSAASAGITEATAIEYAIALG